VTVGAVIQNKDRVFMVKRKREPFKGTWMFPAGFVEFGEHPVEALVRELKEETGLIAEEINFIDIFQSCDDPRSPGHFILFYKVKVSGKPTNMDPDENTELGWHNIHDKINIGWKNHQEIMKRIREEIIDK